MDRSPDNSDEADAERVVATSSRRRFVVGAAKVGSAAGAAFWIAPQLSTVALAQTAVGSPPPDSSTTTEPTEIEPEVVEQPQVSRARGQPGGQGGGGGDSTDVGGSQLAFTGSDMRTLAIAGGAAVATGEALILLERQLRRRELALRAGDATGSSTGPAAGGPGPHDPGMPA